MGHPKFSHEDFVGATLAIIAERDVSAVTVAAVSEASVRLLAHSITALPPEMF